MAYATVEDVADDLGRPLADGAETTQVQRWIDRVEARIKQRITDFDERAANESAFVDLVAGVEVDVVVRRINNPTAKKSERLDDYSYSLQDAAAKADLWPTDEEWAELLPSARPRVRSTRLVVYGDR
jgi:hypothetical protein